MSLRDRLQATQVNSDAVVMLRPQPSLSQATYENLKISIHQKLLDSVDLSIMESLSPERLRAEIATLVERLLAEANAVINDAERRNLVRDIQHEMLGLGPLEPLLADPSVSDILVNSATQVYVERRGKLELTDIRFSDDAHLLKIIDKIVSRVGRRIDESSPMVDARLPDGSRVNAIIPPIALDGPVVSIRRFATVPLKMDDLLKNKSLTPEVATLIQGLSRAKVNILISGGTGTGKTTMLNILSANIPHYERIVTIEDAAELQLQQPHVVRLETRPPNIEGKGEITQRSLVKNALRMRPDRIILGEVRGAEAVDMLQAMNTGHDGSLTTLHANTPRDALSRLETMISMASLQLPEKAMRQQTASAIQVVIQTARLSDGTRKITQINEITGMEGDVVTMQDIFTFDRQGTAEGGKVLGRYAASGIRPRFSDKFKAWGISLPAGIFETSADALPLRARR